MKRSLLILLVVLGTLAGLAAPAAARPIDPDDPPDPTPTSSPYDQRWASLMADPSFQTVMAAAGDVRNRTTMAGLRSLLTDEFPISGKALARSEVDASEIDAAREQILSLLVMPESVQDAAASEAKTAPDLATSGGAQDPFFCSQQFNPWPLHASLPRPYGEFAFNRANNFCLPNGPYGNDLCTAVPDRTFTFDFRRACYQHDMSYFWTPFTPANRSIVDDQFLLDMTSDCRAAHPWYSLRRYGCYTVASLYYFGVRVFGGSRYANTEGVPGYSHPRAPGEVLPVFRPFVLPGQNSTCGQYSHAFVGQMGVTVNRGTVVYPTGVVAAATRIVFDFVDPITGRIVATHVTNPARLNCVVHHEPEAFSTWNLPPGRIDVYATYTRWEARENVRQLILGVNVVG